ncbi:hypothetical protein LNO89_26285 [Klebsiella pneumoniae subsp. pneumoniae]|nr:hypothetical protein [Klebsiella pneumoniae subsp. pneumoniae]
MGLECARGPCWGWRKKVVLIDREGEKLNKLVAELGEKRLRPAGRPDAGGPGR